MINMIKYKYKKILIILLLIIMFFIIIANRNYCFAMSDVTNDVTWDSWKPNVEDENALKDKTNIIIGAIRVIGIIVSVGSLMVIGIKVIWGSAEEKANYKQQMMPWILGATMVFGITVIPTTIYEMVTGAFEEASATDTESIQYWEDYIAGYDDGIIKAAEVYESIMPIGLQPHISTLGKYESEIKSLIDKTNASTAYYKGYKEGLKEMQYASSAYSVSESRFFAMELVSKKNIYFKLYTAKKIVECRKTIGHFLKTMDYSSGDWGLDHRGYEAVIKRLEMQITLWKKQAEENGESTVQFEKMLPEYAQQYWAQWASGYKVASEIGYSAYLEIPTTWSMNAAWDDDFKGEDRQWGYRMSPNLVGYQQAKLDMTNSSSVESWYKGVTSAFNAIENGTVETQMHIMNNLISSGQSYDAENFRAFNYIILMYNQEVKSNAGNNQLIPEVIMPE